jgi:DNA-binding CsgD family transcriptional regulator
MTRRQAFVGRDGELAGVLGVAAAAADEQPGLVLLRGEAGAGKTRLLDEVVSRLPARTVVCRGTGVGFLGGRIPYAPLVAALRSLLSRLPDSEVPQVLGLDPCDLGLLMPELGTRQDGASDQARLVAAVSTLLDRAADLRPVVLVLDDLHCADVATLEVLAYLCAGLDRQRIAVVVAFRPDEVDDVLREWLQDVRRAPHVLDLSLGPMTLAETRAQLTDLAGGDRSLLGESLLARIHARSGGNPYAAEALMRAALAGDEVTLPASLREVLVRRTRSLRPETAALLNIVAAVDDRLPVDRLQAIVARSGREIDVDGALADASRAHLVVVHQDGSVGLRHSLLAEALYADLLPLERRRLHLVIADAMEGDREVRPGVVAEHADRAGDSERALRWSLRAARAAESVYAYDEAHRQYVRVRRLWSQVPDPEAVVGADVVEVFTAASFIAAVCSQDVDAVAVIEGVRSWVQADPEADPVRVGVLEARYARVLLDAGRADAALVAARHAVELVPALPPTRERGVVVSCLVHVLDWAGGGPDWEPLADEAVEIARAIGDGAALARALVIRTTVRPDAPGIIDDAQEAVALALHHGDAELVGQCYSNLVDCCQCAGRGREGVEAAREGVAAVTARGLEVRYGAWIAAQGAEISLAYGWWDEAEQFTVAGYGNGRHVQGSNRDYLLVVRAHLAALRGSWERVDADLAGLGVLPAVLELLRRQAHAEALLWRGDPSTALDLVTEHAAATTDRLLALSAPLAWLGARALADVGDDRRRTGSRDHAGGAWNETAAVVDELVERACGDQALPGTRPVQLRSLCAAERTRFANGPVVAPWFAAVSALLTAERPYFLAYSRWRLAQAMVVERDLGSAAESLRQANAEARRLGAAPLLAEIEAMARRTRIDLRPPQRVSTRAVAGVGATLTAREREILGHLAAGRTNGEIAKVLVISTKTASVHVSNILRKLDVGTRYQAAEIAERYLID